MDTASAPRIEVSRSRAAWSSTVEALAVCYQEVAGVADAYRDSGYADLARQIDNLRVLVRAALDRVDNAAADTSATVALARDVWIEYVGAFRDGVEELDGRSDAVQVRARESWIALVASLPEPVRVAVPDTLRRCLACGRSLPIRRFHQFASGAFSRTCADCHTRAIQART